MKATKAQLIETLTKIAHMRCDGDMWFLTPEQEAAGEDGEKPGDDELLDNLSNAVSLARGVLGIQHSGPTRPPYKRD